MAGVHSRGGATGTLRCSPPPGWVGRQRGALGGTLCGRIRYLMLLLLYIINVGRADDRTPYYRLAPTDLGQARRHGGGATSFSTIRRQVDMSMFKPEEERGEHRAMHLMKREGYNPGEKFREDSVFWTWNCQMANPTRIGATSLSTRQS